MCLCVTKEKAISLIKNMSLFCFLYAVIQLLLGVKKENKSQSETETDADVEKCRIMKYPESTSKVY